MLFSATYRLVFGDIISCNGVNLLKLTQSKDLVANRKSTYSNYKNTRFEQSCFRNKSYSFDLVMYRFGAVFENHLDLYLSTF